MKPEKPAGKPGPTRVVLESEDALGSVAAMLSARARDEDDAQTRKLRAFGGALAEADHNLSGMLERFAHRLNDTQTEALVEEILASKREAPDSFAAGAVAGFALGLFAQDAHGRTGVVTSPVETAQTGPGGPGYLAPATGDHDEGRDRDG